MTNQNRGLSVGLVLSAAVVLSWPVTARAHDNDKPLVLKTQGSFMVGGAVLSTPGTFDPTVFPTPPDGQTLHGDHAYVQYQVPQKPRKYPLVMWHGAGQFSKTWESTPDGREGYQSIFLRRDFTTYVIDQPRRGRAGSSTVGTTLTPRTSDQFWFTLFRVGVWPDYFPGVQFPRDAKSLGQYFRQITPDTGPNEIEIGAGAVSALYDKIGEGVLITHSDSGSRGWVTAMKNRNVRAIVSYEPVLFAFPQGELPPPRGFPQLSVSQAEFEKLTKIPIQLVYGDYIPNGLSPIWGLQFWVDVLANAREFVAAVNRHGGDAELLLLPEIGVRGNTHFPFSDLNNLKIADLLSKYLQRKRLDRYPGKGDDNHHGGHDHHASR